MLNLEAIVLDRHAVFEFDSPGLAELVTAAGNSYCFNDFCGNSTCVQAVCAQSLCVDVRRPNTPQAYCPGNLACPPMQSRCHTP